MTIFTVHHGNIWCWYFTISPINRTPCAVYVKNEVIAVCYAFWLDIMSFLGDRFSDYALTCGEVIRVVQFLRQSWTEQV